jgi:predicted nucleic acid-binding protein
VEIVTIKIVDNTFISACLGEIECIDLLDVSCQHYMFSTTSEVYQETVEGFDEHIVKMAYNSIDVFSLNHDKYLELKDWLENRYPQIDTGEISTFLLSLLDYALTGKDYYYITDDRKMKETIPKLNKDPIFMEKLGTTFDMSNFNVVGTVGFIRRLMDKRVVSEEHIEPIINDMDTNGFYLNEATKNYLRGF